MIRSSALAALAVLVLASSVRPRATRPIAAFVATDESSPPGLPAGSHGTVRHRILQVPAPLGRVVRGFAGRPDDAAADRRFGWTFLTGLAGLVLVGPLAALVAGALVWTLPAVLARRDRRSAASSLLLELPDVVDLLLLAVDAGLTVRMALEEIAAQAEGRLADSLRAAVRQVEMGRRMADALDDVSSGLGDQVRPIIGVLIEADRYGTPLHGPLERVSAELALERRRRSEEAARRVPVKLLFPLVFCTLPAFALLTVVPLLAGSLPDLPF
jgi:tight adherence protein C